MSPLTEYFADVGISMDTVLSKDVLTAVALFAVLVGLFLLFKKFVVRKLRVMSKKTSFRLDDVFVDLLQSMGTPFFAVIAIYIASQKLQLPSVAELSLKAIFLVAVVFQCIKVIERIVLFVVKKSFAGEVGTTTITALRIIIRIALWSVGLLVVLSNLGVNVNSLIASLGIGGLAISLALQNVFSDLFASFSILLDKPFEEGDFIVIGEHKGTVKHIGLKTTRIIALQGEEVVISNAELTSARVQNFKKLQKRRIVFSLGVTYDTPLEKIKKIPSLIQGVIDPIEATDFDRAHFASYGDSSLLFEVVYYVESSDYNEYMDAQQEINVEIFEIFTKEGIEFAFPTQTVHVMKS